MRKIIFSLTLCLILTGCTNTLKCTSDVDTGTMNIKQMYKVYSDNDSITKIINTIDYEIIDENLKQNFDSLINFTKSDYELKNIEYDYSNKGNRYSIEAIYDIDSMSDEVFSELVGTKSLKKYRSKLEEQGLVCK